MSGGGRAIGAARAGAGRLAAATLAALLLTAGALPALAAEATPAVATPVAAPDAPDPSLCTAAPVALADIEAAIAAATPTAGTSAMRDVVPTGESADAATVAGVTATVRELVACFNAGELLRAYGLYTPRYLGSLLSRQGQLGQAAYDALATPMPSAPEDRAAILAITDVRILPDGTVGATVTIAYKVIPMPKRFFFTFVRDGEAWRIDGVLGEISFSVP